MLSSFVSRDFGYGYPLSAQQLATVNTYREGEQYKDEDAALEVMHTINKHALTNSPFIQKFDYEINSDGIWNYDHMVVQFEDVVNVLKALNGDIFKYLFFRPQ